MPPGVSYVAPICEAVFVPVFWWCSEAVGRTRGGCLASLGTSRPEPVGHHHQVSQPPPVVPGPLPLNIVSCFWIVSLPAVHIPVYPGRVVAHEERIDCDDAFFTRLRITWSLPHRSRGRVGSIWSQSWNGGAMGRAARTQHQLNQHFDVLTHLWQHKTKEINATQSFFSRLNALSYVADWHSPHFYSAYFK